MNKVREETGKLFCVVKFCCYCFHFFFSRSNDKFSWPASVFVCTIYDRKLLYFSLTLDAIPSSERETENHLIFHYLHFSGFTGSSCLSIRVPPLPPRQRPPVPFRLPLVMNILRFDIMSSLYQKF